MRFSALAAFKYLADDDLAGSQLCPGPPTSLPQDQVLINLLSLHSSSLAPQAQHAASGYDKVTIQVLGESQIDMPMEGVKDYVPSPVTYGARPATQGRHRLRVRIQDISAPR